VGGYNAGALASAELYDSATGSWTPTGSLAEARTYHTATHLSGAGKVLVAGGWNSGDDLRSAELYDPVTGTWTTTGSIGIGRRLHASVLLSNGKVLVAGGWNSGGDLRSAELFTSTVLPTFKSGGIQDGWVRETSETSNQGGPLNAISATFVLGDDANNRQYRAILHFNTSSLPDNAVITRVALKIKKESVTGTDPFTTHGKIVVGIRQGAFSNSAALQSTDFQNPASKSLVGLIANNPTAGGWYFANLKPTAHAFINRTGVTQFRLSFQIYDDNDAIADFIRFYSGDAAAASRPVLVVEYVVP
jgi:hypothetical protein